MSLLWDMTVMIRILKIKEISACSAASHPPDGMMTSGIRRTVANTEAVVGNDAGPKAR